MRYSSRHDGEALEIYRDIEDEEILENTDADMRDIAVALGVRERDEVEVKLGRDKSDVNINTEEVAYEGKQPSLAEQAEIIEDTLIALDTLLTTAPEESQT